MLTGGTASGQPESPFSAARRARTGPSTPGAEATVVSLDQQQIRRLLDLGRGLVATLNVEEVLDEILEAARGSRGPVTRRWES